MNVLEHLKGELARVQEEKAYCEKRAAYLGGIETALLSEIDDELRISAPPSDGMRQRMRRMTS